MGQQLSITAQTAPSIAVSSYVDIIKDIHYVSQLNSSRFLKTCKALDKSGEVIVKIFLKTDTFHLNNTINAISQESDALKHLPNVLHYTCVFETERAGYLMRQHLNSNLYNRLCSRPFFKNIELKFLCFQLLNILKDIHSRKCIHGDIKLENLLITSGNWLLLTDFSKNLKPVYIPEDNPNEYSFYFNTSQRSACYLAPERFDNTKLDNVIEEGSQLTEQMDIFSAGCCIFEILTEAGKPLFNFSDIFKYKNNEIDLRKKLQDDYNLDEHVSLLIMDMIDVYSERRLSADDILKKYKNLIFPEHFYSVTYQAIQNLIISESNTKIPTNSSIVNASSKITDSPQPQFLMLQSITDNVFVEFYKKLENLCKLLNYPLEFNITEEYITYDSLLVKLDSSKIVHLKKYHELHAKNKFIDDQSALIFVSVLTKYLRVLKYSDSQIKCMDSLIIFSQFIDDNSKVDNILPYFVMMLFSKNVDVQAVAMQKCVQLLLLFSKVDSENENLLIDYVLPKFKLLLKSMKHTSYGRIMFAQNMSGLTKAVYNFQDIILKQCLESGVETGDTILELNTRVIKYFESLTITLLTDEDMFVRIAFLKNISPICRLLGKERANDVILSHLITYLNDKSFLLRNQFIQTISEIAILLGPISFEQYILPLMIQAITDPEEGVTMTALKTLFNIIRVGLLKSFYFTDTCLMIAPLLLHPNETIRQFALSVLILILSGMRTSEKYCVVYPIIKPYFDLDLEITPELLILGVREPITRKVFNIFYTWCLNSKNSLFWKKQLHSSSADIFGYNNIEFVTKDYLTKTYGFRGSQAQKDYQLTSSNVYLDAPLSAEDKNWMEKLKKAGLKDADTWKLTLLRGYIFKVVKMSPRKAVFDQVKPLGLVLENILSDRSLLPKNVFFKINFIPDYKKEKLFIVSRPNNTVLSNTSSVVKKNHKNISKGNDVDGTGLPKAIALNGSLILPNKPKATRNSNFENVYVQLETSSSPHEDRTFTSVKKSNRTKFTVSNSYEGDSETIKQFLKTIHVSPDIISFKEFGSYSSISQEENSSVITSLKGAFATCITHDGNQSDTNITYVACSLNKPYMITSTDCGSITLWNIKKLEENKVFNFIAQTKIDSNITCVEFLKGFNSFLVSTKDGKVLIYSIQPELGSTGSSEIKLVSEYNFEDTNEHGLKINTMSVPHSNIFFVLTSKGRIFQFDAVTMHYNSLVEVKKEFGTVISILISPDMSWMLLGTISGFLVFWDIRFNCVIKSWTFGDQSPIYELYNYPSSNKKKASSEKLVLIVGGSSMCIASLWDLAKMKCKKIIKKTATDTNITAEEFNAKESISKTPQQFSIHNLFLNSVVLDVKGENVLIWESEKQDITTLSLMDENSLGHVLIGSEKDTPAYRVSKLSPNIFVYERSVPSHLSSASFKHGLMSGNIQYLKVLHTQEGKSLLCVFSNTGRFDIYK